MFLAPKSEQYGHIDRAAKRLATILEDHETSIRGVSYTFRRYGFGYETFDKVQAEGISIRYGRIQDLVPDSHGCWNDCGALDTVTIGKTTISLYEDFSGPSFSIHVGDEFSWNSDKRTWLESPGSCGINERLNGKPKTTLRYDAAGVPNGSFRCTNRLSPYLQNSTDLCRMYPAAEGEHKGLLTVKVLDQFAEVIEKVCDSIEAGTTDQIPAITAPAFEPMAWLKDAVYKPSDHQKASLWD